MEDVNQYVGPTLLNRRFHRNHQVQPKNERVRNVREKLTLPHAGSHE